MAAVDKLPDLILENILARLDPKPLLRCRCVSKYWNRLITDPYFMKSRARRRIILNTGSKLLDVADDNKVSSPYEPWRSKDYWKLRVLGTTNGIVLFQHSFSKQVDLMLYNPLTRKYMLLPLASDGVLRCKFSHFKTYAYGFGYGNATPDDLKVVRFREYNKYCPNNICGTGYCEIFSLKEFTWSEPREMNIKRIAFEDHVGTFLNGFLYWIPEEPNKLIVLDVAKIVLSEIHLPFKRSDHKWVQWPSFSHLGTINGCLCLLIRSHNLIDFNLWVMNDQADENSWSIRCSFKIPKDAVTLYHHVICISDNGRILMSNNKTLHIYDPSDDSYTVTEVLTNGDNRGIEYVETLVSLSDGCSSS